MSLAVRQLRDDADNENTWLGKMNFKGIEICCPQCRGDLDRCGDELVCRGCGRTYPVALEIPDLRVFPDPYICPEDDRAKGRRLAERFYELDFEGFVEHYYSITPVVSPRHAQLYKRGLMAAQGRAEDWLRSWEAAAGTNASAERLLELGCGTAPVLEAAKQVPLRVGVDIAFRWLVVGKKRLMEAGIDLPLICACAEALPFPGGSFDRVVADSVIEHLRDQPRALSEVGRVLRPGGHFFVATPNRFSLGPDPQTKIWAGGWLPQGWTAALVRRQSGLPPVRRLCGVFGLKRLLSMAGFRDIRVFLPEIPAKQRSVFSPTMKGLMATYDYARRFPLSRALLFLIGPMLQAVATRPTGSPRT